MKQHIRLISWAMGISFLGSLPLGTLNLTVANFTFLHNLPGAFTFSVAAISVEMLLVRIALLTVRKLETLTNLLRFFHLIAGVVLLLLAFNTLNAAWERQVFQAELPFSNRSPFLSGLLLSLINPLHLPFWIGWTAVLKSRQVLNDKRGAYNFYVLSIGMGTAMAYVVYGLAGDFLIDHLLQQHVLLNWMIGIILLATGLMQFYKTFFPQPVKGVQGV